MRKFILYSLLPLLLMGCRKGENKSSQQEAYAVQVEEIQAAKMASTRLYVGSLQPQEVIDLTFPLGGTLTWLGVKNGQTVKKGDAIARIDETTARSIYDAAKAKYNQAEDGYERLLKVHQAGGISEARWIEMQTDLEQAKQAFTTAAKNLSDCQLTAPCQGVVSLDNIGVGSAVTPGMPFARIMNNQQMCVRFAMPEKEVGQMHIGDTVLVTLPALNDQLFQALISQKSVVANPVGHTYNIEASLLRTQGQNLLTDMVAKVKVQSPINNGIVLPSSCITTLPQGRAVWVVKDNHAMRQLIEVGDYMPDGVLVTGGLEMGDLVVVKGYQKLYPGAPVTIL